jgi:hypothetical protein
MFKAMWEDQSPTPEFIRKDVCNKFINIFNITDPKELKILDNIVNHRIRDDKFECEFSWRGYFSFEIDKSIAHSLKPEFNALKVLRKYLTPLVIHRLYRYPDGLRFNMLRRSFEYKSFKIDSEMKL